MQPSPVASLLVAALVVLRQPCARNKATARLLLERAAEYDSLTAVEREACRTLVDDLDIECVEPALDHTPHQSDTTHACRTQHQTADKADFQAVSDAPAEERFSMSHIGRSASRAFPPFHRGGV